MAWEASKPLSIEEVTVAPPKQGEVRVRVSEMLRDLARRVVSNRVALS